MSVVLRKEDLPYIAEMYHAMTEGLANVSPESIASDRFGARAMAAVSNLACTVAKSVDFDKAKFVKIIEELWDEQEMPDDKIIN